MSDKAVELLRQAVQEFLQTDDATNQGAYRDAITDLLHLAYKDEKIRKAFRENSRDNFLDYLFYDILENGYGVFEEEAENRDMGDLIKFPIEKVRTYVTHFSNCRKKILKRVEMDKVMKTPKKKLPLLIGKLKYDCSIDILQSRLKGNK